MTPEEAILPQRSRELSHYVFAVALTGVLVLWNLGGTKLDGHECFVAVTGQTITQSERWIDADYYAGEIPPNTPLNHWLIPVFNKLPRLVKTPMAYWCVAGLAKMGLPLNEFTVRLPSAMSAMLLVAVTLALGRSLFSRRAALLGALMLATSLIVLDWGRNARADMQMTFWMTLTMACVYWAMQAARGKRHALFFAAWVTLGMANLCKPLLPFFLALPVLLFLAWRAADKDAVERGDLSPARPSPAKYFIAAAVGYVLSVAVHLVPWLQWWHLVGASESIGIAATMAALLGLPVAWYFIRCRGWRELPPALPTAIPGAVVMLAMFVPWMAYIAHVFPQGAEVFSKQTLDRGMGTAGWLARQGSLLDAYYLVDLAKWVLPWTIFLPGAMAIPFMKRFREDRQGLTFLLLWTFAIVLLLSASVGKRGQYIMPAIPAVCLLMGYCAEDVFVLHRWFTARLAKSIVYGFAVAVTLCALGAKVFEWAAPGRYHALAGQVVIIAAVSAVVLWLAVMAWRKARPLAAAHLMVVAVAAGSLAYVTNGALWQGEWEHVAGLAKQAAGRGDVAAAWRDPDPAFVWYAGCDLSVAVHRRAVLVKGSGEEEGQRRWMEWLHGHQPPLCLIVEGKDIREAEEAGLVPETSIKGLDPDDSALFRSPQAR